MTTGAALQYRKLIETAVAASSDFEPLVEGSKLLQVERGLVLPLVMSARDGRQCVDRLLQQPGEIARSELVVVDACGHHREVYRPLLIYCWLVAFERTGNARWGEPLKQWCDLLHQSRTDIAKTAANGSAVTEYIWASLANVVEGGLFGDHDRAARGASSIRDLCNSQQLSGAFLIADLHDNPETHWYHELILLHAVASFAARTDDSSANESARRAAEFHLVETQPDHATAQPWGLPAFLRYAPLLADQVLHAMTTQQPGRIDGVSLMLLADTLYGLDRSTDLLP